jgi:L-cysteine desulfidase
MFIFKCIFTVKDIFKIQVAPALGCTKPVAIALGPETSMPLRNWLPDKPAYAGSL